MAKKIDTQLLNFLKQVDHHDIYKLHMSQARATRKEFKNNPEVLAKISLIEQKILATYEQACAKEQKAAE